MVHSLNKSKSLFRILLSRVVFSRTLLINGLLLSGLVGSSLATAGSQTSCHSALSELAKLATESDYNLFEATIEQGLSREEMMRIQILTDSRGNQTGLLVRKTGNRYKDLRATPLAIEGHGLDVKTMMFHHQSGIAPVGAKAVVVLLHGIGADISHSGAMLQLLAYLSGPKSTKVSSTTSRIHEKHIPLGVVAIDGVGNGYGPSLTAIDSASKATSLLYLELQKIKTLARGLPLIVFARSSSTGHTVAVNKRYPGLISAMILMSPVTSEPKAFAQADKGVLADVAEAREKIALGLKPDFVINEPVLNWDSQNYRQMRWHLDPAPLGTTSTLVIVGGADKQTPDLVQRFYQKIVKAVPDDHGQYLFVPGAGHDVVSTVPRTKEDTTTTNRAVATFHAIYDFISGVLPD
jgi:pimeloyl-ACP methyl ester carboxylesterase